MNNEHKGGKFWIGFFLGGIFGAVLIFLWGTKEGKKVAKKIIDQGEIFEEEIEEKIGKLQEKGEALLSEAQGVKDRVMREVEEGKKNVSEQLVVKMDKALSQLEDLQQKGVAVTQHVHRRYFKKNGKKLVAK